MVTISIAFSCQNKQEWLHHHRQVAGTHETSFFALFANPVLPIFLYIYIPLSTYRITNRENNSWHKKWSFILKQTSDSDAQQVCNRMHHADQCEQVVGCLAACLWATQQLVGCLWRQRKQVGPWPDNSESLPSISLKTDQCCTVSRNVDGKLPSSYCIFSTLVAPSTPSPKLPHLTATLKVWIFRNTKHNVKTPIKSV